ncbi:PDZ domain-containing protein [bacterium]|nr:PDZ domain-containing protein [bacterium]NBX49136.1 PDZ domain-containing protein [bacterium]
MDSSEDVLFRRAFGAGILGAFFGIVLVSGGVWLLYQDPRGKSWIHDRISSLLLTEEVPTITDTTGTIDPLVSVVAAADPAVVSLVVTKEVPIYERYYERANPFGEGFSGFLIPQYRENGTREEEVSGGTGFFISSDGYLVTNNHVIDVEESSYTVYLNDGASYPASLIATDALLDVALLKVDAPGVSFSSLSFADSDKAQAGQTVIAIGNALGEYRNTVSVGVISGLSRSVFAATTAGSAELLQDIIQTDAAINPGNSGGPLLDLSGKVVGVNVAASVGSAENIGFALPANAVRVAVESMKEHGRILRPWLGVRYDMITPEFAESAGLPVTFGALIRRGGDNEPAVIPGSPADKAGLVENDIILSVNGEFVNDSHDLGYLLRLNAPGDVVVLRVMHEAEEREYQVTLEERPAE